MNLYPHVQITALASAPESLPLYPRAVTPPIASGDRTGWVHVWFLEDSEQDCKGTRWPDAYVTPRLGRWFHHQAPIRSVAFLLDPQVDQEVFTPASEDGKSGARKLGRGLLVASCDAIGFLAITEVLTGVQRQRIQIRDVGGPWMAPVTVLTRSTLVALSSSKKAMITWIPGDESLTVLCSIPRRSAPVVAYAVGSSQQVANSLARYVVGWVGCA